jgi:hypothetical protein
MSDDDDLRREAFDAIFTAFDQASDRRGRLIWVMSKRWRNDIRRWVQPEMMWLSDVDPQIEEWMLGIPIEIRDDAGFPQLVERGVVA